MWRLIVRSILVQALVLLLPFIAAGTLTWVRGWCWLGFQILTLTVSVALMRLKNPTLLRARMEHARPLEGFDRVFSQVYLWSMAGLLVVAGMDRRREWSHLSWDWFYPGIVLGCLGVIPILAASSINPYLEGFVRIQSDRGHQVITSGVYSIVRHPMYTGLILVILSWPLVLGSRWALVPAVLAALAYPFRAVHEERVLRERLPGYKEYMQRTPYRLVPGLW
ncbi:MAG TPA: isoprenylcysteine carboxylmethyltransferase family protein [Bryobacteraceae bacterium]|nr:isoprenylcysteine carboxylmethyltransferase family protein [Bryobacteraceae bacterium]